MFSLLLSKGGGGGAGGEPAWSLGGGGAREAICLRADNLFSFSLHMDDFVLDLDSMARVR